MRDVAHYDLKSIETSERQKAKEEWIESRGRKLKATMADGERLADEKLYRALPKLNRFLWLN